MTPEQVVTAGAGVVALVYVFRIVWQGYKGQKSVDDRVVRMLDEYRESNADLNARNRELSDRNHSLTKEMIRLAQDHNEKVAIAIKDIQTRLADAHRKLNECEKQHEDCRRDVDQLRAFVMESMGPRKE